MTSTARDLADKLSELVRSATLEAHETAERAQFVQDLLGGRLPIDDYARLAAQHHAIYAALERAVVANDDPVIAEFLDPALVRLPAIEHDLEHLAGTDWADRLERLPATDAYVDHIDQACAASSVALVAHHYVRYLGDLSGGQVIGRVLTRTYGLSGHDGTEFYRFTDIGSPKAYKDRYRDLLDSLPYGAAERAELIAEVNIAYELNTAVFEGLGDVSTPCPTVED